MQGQQSHPVERLLAINMSPWDWKCKDRWDTLSSRNKKQTWGNRKLHLDAKQSSHLQFITTVKCNPYHILKKKKKNIFHTVHYNIMIPKFTCTNYLVDFFVFYC